MRKKVTVVGAGNVGANCALRIADKELADVVLVKADPTKDINNAKLVDTVIKNGVVVDRSKLDLPVNRRPSTQ